MLQVGEMIIVEDKIYLQNLWIYFDDKRISATYSLFFLIIDHSEQVLLLKKVPSDIISEHPNLEFGSVFDDIIRITLANNSKEVIDEMSSVW